MKFDLGKQFVSGEFKIIHKDKEGNIKQELDWQPNMFLENGLKVLFNDENTPPYISNGNVATENQRGTYVPQHLVIGTGNTIPAYNQIALANATHITNYDENTILNPEPPDNSSHQGYLKTSNQLKYTFSNFTDNYNITEIGLTSWRESSNNLQNYTLCTRALIKDNTGTAIPITVLKGEVLIVYYKVNVYIDTRRKTGSFTLTDIDSNNRQTTHTFDYFIQPISLMKNSAYGAYKRHYITQYRITSRGVLEADSELNSSYNLNDNVYNQIKYDDYTPLKQKVASGNDKYSIIQNGTNIADTNHARYESFNYNWANKTITMRIINGINTHNWDNGIRAFYLPIPINLPNTTSLSVYLQLVVVKNRANGQGIKKTNTKEWTVEWSYTIDKWD